MGTHARYSKQQGTLSTLSVQLPYRLCTKDCKFTNLADNHNTPRQENFGGLSKLVYLALFTTCKRQGFNIFGMDHPQYTAEFEFKASRKMLFPYINTASGLSQWFADDVIVDEDKIYTFSWDEEQAQARLAAQRLNKFVKFEFLNNPTEAPGTDNASDNPVVEMRLEENDLTGTVFLNINDSVTADNEEEFRVFWNQMADSLREIVGG